MLLIILRPLGQVLLPVGRHLIFGGHPAGVMCTLGHTSRLPGHDLAGALGPPLFEELLYVDDHRTLLNLLVRGVKSRFVVAVLHEEVVN